MENLVIENKNIRLSVSTRGASIESIYDKVGNQELQWQGDEKYWKYKDVVIFPIIGRPEDGYEIDGRTYECNMPHGFAREKEFTVVEYQPDMVLLELVADEQTWELYPFDFKLRVEYVLDNNKVMLSYFVSNDSEKEMPFQLGGHLGMNLKNGVNRILFDEKIDVKYYRYQNGLCAETPEILFKNTKEILLTESLYEQLGSLVLERPDCRYVTLERTDGLKIRYDIEDSNTLTIWALNNKGTFACIEPWWGLCDKGSTPRELSKKEKVNILKAGTRRFGYSFEIIRDNAILPNA